MIRIDQIWLGTEPVDMRAGMGIWLATRRLHKGSFTWSPADTLNPALSEEQWQALVMDLPWHRIGPRGVIRIL